MNVERRTLGELIDQALTTDLKVKTGVKEAVLLLDDLNLVIEERMSYLSGEVSLKVLEATKELAGIISTCWEAQEIVMSNQNIYEVAKAAKVAQQMNVERNRLMRKINQLSQESGYITEKTYA